MRFIIALAMAGVFVSVDGAASVARKSANGLRTIKLPAGADEHDYVDAAKLSMRSAVRMAMKRAPGVLLWAGLEDLDGFLFYAVQTAGKGGKLSMVTLDAGTGAVQGVQSRTRAQEALEAAREAADDAKKAKADPNSEEARKAREGAAARENPRAPAFHSSVVIAADAGGAALAASPRIPADRAIGAALAKWPGRISTISLAQDQGNVYFAVTVKSADGKLTLVAVDAGNASILGTQEGG